MSEFLVKLAEARKRLPLRRLMEQRGKSPSGGGNWKSFACPYCGHKSAGVFKGNGGELFKCHHEDCPSGTQHDKSAWDEIGFLAHELGLSRQDAAMTYLKEAGVWQERCRLPATPGKAGRLMPRPSVAEEYLPSDPEAEESLPPMQDTPTESPPEESEDLACAAPDPLASAAGSEPSPGSKVDQTPGAGVFEPITESQFGAGPAAVPDGPPDAGSVPAGDAVQISEKERAQGTEGTEGNDKIVPLPSVYEVKIGGGGGDNGSNSHRDNPYAGPLGALREFFEQTKLTDKDEMELWKKRGLTPATCAALGFRSNQKSNKEILLGMKDRWPMRMLLKSGLYVPDGKPGEPPRPNPQFYGWGIVGKNKETGKFDWGWTEPILIPYLDAGGELIDLRPHKGMMRGKAIRLYVPRVIKHLRRPGVPGWSYDPPETTEPRFVVFCEGEFKAAAIRQALLGIAHVASLPGITTAKPLFGDIEDWLASLGVCSVVAVAYDNEEKGDPNLPGYKPDKLKRFEAEVWARYLGRQITKEGYDGRVAHLPNEWRDAKGKADWDGACAKLLRELTEKLAAPGLPGIGLSPEEVWGRFGGKVRAEFLAVLEAAVKVEELWRTGFFDGEEELIIRGRLERVSYEPRLPVGGDHELSIARRLFQAASTNGDEERLSSSARRYLVWLGKKYLGLSGGYYRLRPLREQTQEQWIAALGKASELNDVEVKRACEIVLKGVPEQISDFYMKPHYVLNRVNGTRERVVSIHNKHGVSSKLVNLPSAAFSQPSRFREWLLDNSTGATWRAGEREMNDLQADVAWEVSHKEVIEVVVRGYHEDSKLWFFQEVVYTLEGKELFPDKVGVIWHEGKGYRMSDTDQEGEHFAQGEPSMQPSMTTSKEEERELFRVLSQYLFETIGGYEGYLALGAILAYAAAPELYSSHTAFPGLWLHGETNQGKSSVARWLLRVWGFRKESGMPLPDSTKVGVSIALQQYGNLPLWLEEYQPDCPKWMQEKIKEVYNRESGGKKTFGEGHRKIRGGVIITGVATSPDSQVRSRYCHVQVSESKRIANHYDWFEENSPRFYQLGRWLMRNRKEFVRLFMRAMASWMESKDVEAVGPRTKLVHGAAYAAFLAAAGLLETHEAKDMQAFRSYLVQHCQMAISELREQVNVDQFWADVLAGVKANAFGKTPAELRQIFKVVENKRASSPVGREQQKLAAEMPHTEWKSYRLYFLPGPLMAELRRYLRSQGRELPLDKNDLRAQMRTRPYWEQPEGDCHRQRFGVAKASEGCWCINVDKHELGYRPVGDEEFKASLLKEDGLFVGTDDWLDPRRGDLFALIDSLLRPRETQTEAS